MKTNFLIAFILGNAAFIFVQHNPLRAQNANKTLSNLTTPTSINTTLLPQTNNTIDLGSSDFSWHNITFRGTINWGGLPFISRNGSGTFVGWYAGENNTGTYGSYNCGFGQSALESNTSGIRNTAVGYQALRDNISTSGNTAVGYYSLANNQGADNTALGQSALSQNTTGIYNSAVGVGALLSNKTGNYNSAFGSSALSQDTTGSYNTAVGNEALYFNNSSNNTAIGYRSLYYTKTGSQNTASGYYALYNNSSGSYNTAVGTNALKINTTQAKNTAVGWSAGDFSTSSASTFLGHKASANVNSVDNSTALGFLATVTASNQIRLGQTGVTSIGGQVGWSTLSDGRYKKEVNENVPGLMFINKLKPVTYRLDASALSKSLNESRGDDQEDAAISRGIQEREKLLYTGFIAQEVEEAARAIGYDFSGVDAPKNEQDLYGLRYAEFVVPLVKSVQELSQQNEQLQIENHDLKERLDKVEAMLTNTSLHKSDSKNESSLSSTAYLEQNIPNPFRQATVIKFNIPSSSSNAVIKVYSLQGEELKSFDIHRTGYGEISFAGDSLPSGIYTYVLKLDGKAVDTKQMILTK